MDRETVITRLQVIHTWAEVAREYDLQFLTAKHLEDIAQWSDDALALLKEQEAVEPFHKCTGKEYTLIENSHFDYCPYCGKTITWEGR